MNYLHLGKGTVVREDTVIGIFDLDISSQSHLTRKYLQTSEKAGQVVNASEDIPKSFVVCKNRERVTVYLSQLAPATLMKRGEIGYENYSI